MAGMDDEKRRRLLATGMKLEAAWDSMHAAYYGCPDEEMWRRISVAMRGVKRVIGDINAALDDDYSEEAE